jgi:hypothetical protein
MGALVVGIAVPWNNCTFAEISFKIEDYNTQQ